MLHNSPRHLFLPGVDPEIAPAFTKISRGDARLFNTSPVLFFRIPRPFNIACFNLCVSFTYHTMSTAIQSSMSLPLQEHTESCEAVSATTNIYEPAPRKRKRVKTGKPAGSAIIELPCYFESPRLIVMLLGCLTCRARKVKCDETHPLCNNCSNLNVQCRWSEGSHGSQDNLGMAPFKSLQYRYSLIGIFYAKTSLSCFVARAEFPCRQSYYQRSRYPFTCLLYMQVRSLKMLQNSAIVCAVRSLRPRMQISSSKG